MNAAYIKKIICAGLAGLMLALTACGDIEDKARSGGESVSREGSISQDESSSGDADDSPAGSVSEVENTSSDENSSRTVQNENGAVVSFKYSESNIENDMMTFWKVYREADRYFIYYMNELSEESEKYEISEDEYHAVMSFDFAGGLAEYEAKGGNGTEDGICYELELSYEDGKHYHTWAKLNELNNELYDMLAKYHTGLSSDISDDSAVEVHYIESGGIDGRLIDRAVYKEGRRYIFAYSEGFKQEPKLFEISEEEYNEIMSLDYEKAIAKYEAASRALIYDGIYYSVRVVCENGDVLSGEVESRTVAKKFAHLYKKYIGDTEIDN